MSITKGLLEMMGSSLEVNSIYGAGSEFCFALKQTVVKWDPLGNFEETQKKKAEDIKERYPQLKSSFSLNLDSFHNFQENKNILTPRISRINSGISTKDKKIFSANKKLNRNYKSLNDIDFHSFSMIKSKDKRIKSSKTILSLKNINKKTNEIIKPKKR